MQNLMQQVSVEPIIDTKEPLRPNCSELLPWTKFISAVATPFDTREKKMGPTHSFGDHSAKRQRSRATNFSPFVSFEFGYINLKEFAKYFKLNFCHRMF